MTCRHCRIARASRPRGLCWKCFYTPGVRDRYPTSDKKCGRRGIADFYGRHRAPSVPTSALPGTPEKVAVLMERAEQRQSLWHPEDATLDLPKIRHTAWPVRAVTPPPWQVH